MRIFSLREPSPSLSWSYDSGRIGREGGCLKRKENISVYYVQSSFIATQGRVNSNYGTVNVEVS